MHDVAGRLNDVIEALRDEIVVALSTLVRIPSVNPSYPGVAYDETVGAESLVSRTLAGFYGTAKCEVDIFEIAEGRANCVGVLAGSGGGKSLLFNGHVDVVPPGERQDWNGEDPWSGRFDGERVWGRGACDMKAGLVAQAFAARALVLAGIELRGDLILQAVVGEEMMEHELGTTACVERGYRADAAIVAEPTSPPAPLTVAPATAGALWLQVSIEGKPAHTSLRGETIRAGGAGKELAVNAIDKLFLVYRALLELEQEWGLSKLHPLFRPGHFTIHPGVIVAGPRSGLVPFVIPDLATIDYVLWYPPAVDHELIIDEVKRHISHVAELDPWLAEIPPRIECKHHWPSSNVELNHPLIDTLCVAHELSTGRPATIGGFPAVNDTVFLTRAGIPAISYGPGDLRRAHAVNEYVRMDEVVEATRTLALAASTWCEIAN